MSGPIQLLTMQTIPTALTPAPTPAPEMQNKETVTSADIQAAIAELLSKCRISFYRAPYDQNLHDLCLQECVLKGYPIDNALGKDSILKHIPLGVVMASTAYGHLKSQPAGVFIAVYTAFIMWADDRYAGDISGLDAFNERFAKGQKQESQTLDALACLLRDINGHWNGTQANVILTSSLNFITGLIIEFETQRMTVLPHAGSYVTFQRTMSGAGEAYAMFAFPPELPVSNYIQALPEASRIWDHVNDVLSFYKEERAGETINYISNEANVKGDRKLKVLRDLAHQVSLSVSRGATILEGHQAAKDAFQGFVEGYRAYHTSCEFRYHLSDLFPLQ